MTYIEASLSKALKVKDLLSGNNPSEGWGSRYSGNPKSLSHFHHRQRVLLSEVIRRIQPQVQALVVLHFKRILISGNDLTVPVRVSFAMEGLSSREL